MSGIASERRHLTLRIVATVCTGVGAILLAIGVALLAVGLYGIAAGATGVRPGPVNSFAPAQPVGLAITGGLAGAVAAIWSVGVLVAALQFLGVGAFLRLAIQVEENTRASARSLELIRGRMAARADDAGTVFLS